MVAGVSDRTCGACTTAPRSRSAAARRRAFSLAELVLVLAIIGILAAIAVPRYAGAVSHYRLDVAARRIAADLAVARSQARTTSASQSVIFDVAANRYEMPGFASPNGGAAAYAVDLGADPFFVALVGVDFGGGATVTFDAYGFPDHSGKVAIEAGGLTRTITLDEHSGKVIVE